MEDPWDTHLRSQGLVLPLGPQTQIQLSRPETTPTWSLLGTGIRSRGEILKCLWYVFCCSEGLRSMKTECLWKIISSKVLFFFFNGHHLLVEKHSSVTNGRIRTAEQTRVLGLGFLLPKHRGFPFSPFWFSLVFKSFHPQLYGSELKTTIVSYWA